MPLQIGQPLDHDFTEPLGLLSDCHRRIEYFLDVLIRLSASQAPPLTPEHWKELEKAVNYFAVAGPRHVADEEESLFPRLRSTHDPRAVEAIGCLSLLERDHELADAHHRAVDRFCRRWLDLGFLSDADKRNLQDRLAELHAIYREHILIEDQQLFPAAERVLSERQLLEIGREMQDRHSV